MPDLQRFAEEMITVAPDDHQFTSLPRPIAIFPSHGREFEATFSIKLRPYVEDGLGDALGRVIRLESGRHFILKELLQAKESRLFAEADDADRTPEGLRDLLSELGLSQDDCLWSVAEGYESVESFLLREDDNGNRFVVDRYPSRIDAKLRMEELSRGGHKQFYWIEPANSEQGAGRQDLTRSATESP